MTYKNRRLATIDIGTNSVLMLVAERNENGKLTVLADESRVTRLGEGSRLNKMISPQALDRTCSVLAEYAAIARKHNVQEIQATATSAAREAKNQEEFAKRASESASCEVEIIPPNEEARLTYLSVTTELVGEDPSMVIDIGGGSTEVTWGLGSRFDGGRSLDLGTVKILEEHLKGDPPSAEEIERARKEVDQRLSRVTPLGTLKHYFGTAGSFTHLAAIDMELNDYHPNKIAGHILSREKVGQWIHKFSSSPRSEYLSLPGVDPRRIDVLLSGSLIIERLFEKFKMSSFTVHDRGIRFGKLFDRLRGFIPPIEFV